MVQCSIHGHFIKVAEAITATHPAYVGLYICGQSFKCTSYADADVEARHKRCMADMEGNEMIAQTPCAMARTSLSAATCPVGLLGLLSRINFVFGLIALATFAASILKSGYVSIGMQRAPMRVING